MTLLQTRRASTPKCNLPDYHLPDYTWGFKFIHNLNEFQGATELERFDLTVVISLQERTIMELDLDGELGSSIRRICVRLEDVT